MAFVPVPFVAEVDIITTSHGSRLSNTLYFWGSAAWDATNLLQLAQDVHTWWHTEARDFMSTDIELVQIDARSLASESAPGISYFPTANTGGSVASPGLPNNATLAVTFRTAMRGRSFRGRNYLVGLPESLVTGDSVLTATVSGIIAAYNALNTYVSANNGAQHTVVSRISAGVERNPGIDTLVTSYASDGVIDSQRRRLLGRGA